MILSWTSRETHINVVAATIKRFTIMIFKVRKRQQKHPENNYTFQFDLN